MGIDTHFCALFGVAWIREICEEPYAGRAWIYQNTASYKAGWAEFVNGRTIWQRPDKIKCARNETTKKPVWNIRANQKIFKKHRSCAWGGQRGSGCVWCLSLYHVFLFSVLSDLDLLRLVAYLAAAQMDQCHFFGHLWVWHHLMCRLADWSSCIMAPLARSLSSRMNGEE